jgi:hypothetical protein
MHPVLFATALTLASTVPGTACLDNPPSAITDARCAQLAAAARLRGRQDHPAPEPVQAAIGSTGKGALVGLGIGLGLGLIAALVVAPGCEENSGQCSVGFIVGGSALGAGIGAAVER